MSRLATILSLSALMSAAMAADPNSPTWPSSGNVGIGTATPASKLVVQDSSYPTTFTGLGTTIGIGNNIQNGQYAKLTFGNNNGNHGGIGLQVTGTGSYLNLGTSNNYANGITNTAIVIDPNGNVGVGTPTPACRLNIQDGTYQSSFTGLGTTVGIGNGIPTGQFSKLTFGNNAGNHGGMGLQFTGSGSFLHLGTSNNYAAGITNSALVIDPNGKIGVGTSSPACRLNIQDGTYQTTFTGLGTTVGIGNGIPTGQFSKLTFGNNAGNHGGIGLQFTASGSYLHLGTSNNYAAGITNSALVIDPNGNIGVGIAAPANVLHLVSSGNAGARFDISSANGTTGAANLVLANANTTNGNASGIEFVNGGGGPTAFISAINYNHNSNGNTTGGLDFAVYNAGALSHALVISPSGNIGIGVTPTTSALAVNGTISAKEVLVVANPADYVFAPGYRLRPLMEVEAFIREHQHLPGVASAKEQEEHGVLVADLMRAHLEKIEELNLYAIEQQRRIDDQATVIGALRAELVAQRDAVTALAARMSAIETHQGAGAGSTK